MIKKISLIVAGILMTTTLCVNAAKNPYNEMDVVNPTNSTIEDVAKGMGITVEELKSMYSLPSDMPADTNQAVASGYLTVKAYSELKGISVEQAIELIKNTGFTGEITGDTLFKDIYKEDNDANRGVLASSGFVTYDDGNEILVMVKGKYIDFDVAPVIEDNRVLVPMRNIFTALGADVSWHGDVQTVIAIRGNDVIALQPGQNFLFKNSEKIEIPTPAIAKDGRILVPIRAVAEALDTEVFYNGTTKTVVIH